MDFDGPINDNSRRLYQFMINNVSIDISSVISVEEFWTLKRLGIHEADWVGNILGIVISKEKWDRRKSIEIEKESYLRYDQMHLGAKDALREIAKYYNVVIVTRRNNADGVKKQIEKYGLNSLISSLLVIPQGTVTKAEIISNHFVVGANDIFVGDTEDDISSGLELGIETVFVLSGIRSKWIVSKLKAVDKVTIINDISEIRVRNT